MEIMEDVKRKEEIERELDEGERRLGKIRELLKNEGVENMERDIDKNRDMMENILEVNVEGDLLNEKEVERRMIEKGKGG